MVEKISCPLANASCQGLQACLIVQPIQQFSKKHDISGSVDKVPSSSFIVWLPHLNCHRLREDRLVELVLCSSVCLWLERSIIVDDVSSLLEILDSIMALIQKVPLPLPPFGGTNWLYKRISAP